MTLEPDYCLILGHLREARAAALEMSEAGRGSREMSLTITKIDEALLWRCEDLRLRRPAINEEAYSEGAA